VKEKGFRIVTADGWDMHPGLKELSRFLSLELPARRNVGVHANRKQVTVNDPAQWPRCDAAGGNRKANDAWTDLQGPAAIRRGRSATYGSDEVRDLV
jgi:hypothetical protein